MDKVNANAFPVGFNDNIYHEPPMVQKAVKPISRDDFSSAASDKKSSGDCPAGCPKMSTLYPVSKYAVNLPVCQSAVNNRMIGSQGGRVYQVTKNTAGLLEAKFLEYTSSQDLSIG